MQAVFSQHVYLAAQQVFQIGQQPRRKEGAPAWTYVDQKINITARPSLAAHNRTKDAHVGGAVLRGDPQDVLPFVSQQLSQRHRFTFSSKIIAQACLGNPFTVTTDPVDTNDTTPLTTPGDLTDNGMSFPDGETWLFWAQSTDNVTPQPLIRYDVYANGVFDHSLLGADSTILYGNPGGPNTFQVIAVDSAGNQSAPATLTTNP
jgi:hypothetical protein